MIFRFSAIHTQAKSQMMHSKRGPEWTWSVHKNHNNKTKRTKTDYVY